jgi:hypothetical protein
MADKGRLRNRWNVGDGLAMGAQMECGNKSQAPRGVPTYARFKQSIRRRENQSVMATKNGDSQSKVA